VQPMGALSVQTLVRVTVELCNSGPTDVPVWEEYQAPTIVTDEMKADLNGWVDSGYALLPSASIDVLAYLPRPDASTEEIDRL